MKQLTNIVFLILFCFLLSSNANSQEIAGGRLSGNFQIDAQTYAQDSTIGAIDIPKEKMMSNSFLNLLYNLGSFDIGMRYEAYFNPILGFDERYEGNGIAYRYITYRSSGLDVTAGDFYEQFGSGLIFRAYEERQLGFDNAVDGLRFKFRPIEGLDITALIGKQRSFWSKGSGIVRGGDLNISLNYLFPEITPDEHFIDLGASVISKFEQDVSAFYNLPANVLAYSLRLALTGSFYSFSSEWAYKYNDPNASNQFNYNPGTGLILYGAYFEEGIGISLNFHRVDNMDFRSERGATGNNLNLNFIPPLTKQQGYRLATAYPYASQMNGEIGYQFELNYNFPRGSFFGGDYGTDITMNHSSVYSLDTTHTEIDSSTGYAFKYDSPFFNVGNRLYFRDINFELVKRWSHSFKSTITYVNFIYHRDILENEGAPKYGSVNGNIIITDMILKLSEAHSLRIEAEHLWTSQDSSYSDKDFTFGNWMMILAEYTIAPSLFLSVWDEYNYFDTQTKTGESVERNLHYLGSSIAYITGTTRISLGYGRQRGGLMCVGGVCRPVPSSNGFNFSITSSF